MDALQVPVGCDWFFLWIAGEPVVSHPRKPKPVSVAAANDNAPKRGSPNRLPKAEVRLPKAMPVQIVEVEVLAELLESLPPIANDNEDSE